VHGLGNVQRLYLERMSALVSLKGIGRNVQFLSISECNVLTDFSYLKYCSAFVHISHCPYFKYIADVRNAEYLWLDHLPALFSLEGINPAPYHRMKGLILAYLPSLLTLNDNGGGLQMIPSIHIDNCDHLKDINGLAISQERKTKGNMVSEIGFYNCAELSDIGALRDFSDVELVDCNSISDVTPLLACKSVLWHSSLPSSVTLSNSAPISNSDTSINSITEKIGGDIDMESVKGLKDLQAANSLSICPTLSKDYLTKMNDSYNYLFQEKWIKRTFQADGFVLQM